MTKERVKAGNKIPQEMNVIIQIPTHACPIQYRLDNETDTLFVSSFQSTSMHYPCNVGYIPQTHSTSHQPLCVLVITPLAVTPGCVVRCRPLGMLALLEEENIVRRVIAVPIDKIADGYQKIHKIDDLPLELLKRIIHFFTHYKDLETQAVKFEGWLSAKAAKAEILMSKRRFENQTALVI